MCLWTELRFPNKVEEAFTPEKDLEKILHEEIYGFVTAMQK